MRRFAARGDGIIIPRHGVCDAAGFARSHNEIHAVTRAIETGLICLPLPIGMADILHRRLDLRHRIWLSAATILSLPRAMADDLARSVLTDLRPVDPLKSNLFRRIAAEHVRCNPVRPAPRGFDPFAETPRARLAAAWAAASERDRRDLIARATGISL